MKPRPVLRWHGGKWLLAPWILANLPEHRIYCEPFCGAASVLLRKERSYSELINDLDGEVVNVFRVMQNPDSAGELERLLRLTPFARAEFARAYRPARNPIERARRTIVRSFMGFGSAAHNPEHKTGFRNNANRSGTVPAHDWMNYPAQLAFFLERLQGVVVENRPALSIIPWIDSPETLFYVDPPYPLGTRYNKEKTRCYSHEMSDEQHRELADVLKSVKGKVVLSGYPCDLYDRELYPDWRRVERSHLADGARKRIEVLWMNFEPVPEPQSQLSFLQGVLV